VAAARKGGTATLDEVASDPPVTQEEGQGQPPPATTPVQTETKRPPQLPTERTITGTQLENKTILVYGPAGIGKSTLASEFPNRIFFNCAGELNEIECIQTPVPNWPTFREKAWALSEQHGNYGGVVIDTGDKLTEFCSDHVRSVLALSGGTGDVVMDMADLVLFIDWAGEEGGDRVIKTKPHRNWHAKERGQKPRLPEEITWPLGSSGYELLKAAWNDND
jgi:hypothetical protein